MRSTVSRVARETLAPLRWLITSDTVDCDTPASLAMSVMVGRRPRAGLFIAPPPYRLATGAGCCARAGMAAPRPNR
jgi:hypothetical protein